jgi:hypothetical protein
VRVQRLRISRRILFGADVPLSDEKAGPSTPLKYASLRMTAQFMYEF